MLKTCSSFITCHYQIYIPLLKELISTRNVSRLCRPRSKTSFLHHDCRTKQQWPMQWRRALEYLTFFLDWRTECLDLWTQTDIFQHPNSPDFFSLMLQLIQVPKFLCPRRKGLFYPVGQISLLVFYFFYFLPLHSAFLPHFCLLTKFCLPRLYLEL